MTVSTLISGHTLQRLYPRILGPRGLRRQRDAELTRLRGQMHAFALDRARD